MTIANVKDLSSNIPASRRTASALAKKWECSRQTVYTRIEALAESGVCVGYTKARSGARGPTAWAFYVRPEGK